MAIVKTYNIEGATVHILDDYYANRTPEQRQQDYDIMVETVCRLWAKNEAERIRQEREKALAEAQT